MRLRSHGLTYPRQSRLPCEKPTQLNPALSCGSLRMLAAKMSTFLSMVIRKPLVVSVNRFPVGTQVA